jgi:hypothetical protein
VVLNRDIWPVVTLEEVFAFYRNTGYLHDGRLPGLAPGTVETTWKRLLAADQSVFRFVARRALVDDRPAVQNTVCAFAYARETWQIQHLVSSLRHGREGTLGVATDILQWLHRTDVEYCRWPFRPTNPGPRRLFASATERLPRHLIAQSIVDFGATPRDEVALDDDVSLEVRVIRVSADTVPETIAFYRDLLHPVELESLALADPELELLSEQYHHAGLMRRRTVLHAMIGERVAGACLVNHSAPGINLASFGNAIEHLRVANDLSGAARRSVWTALARAAVADARRNGAYIVAALHPADRELAVAAGLVQRDPKQYAIVTVSGRENGFLRLIECFTEYYAARLRARNASR